MRIFIPALTLAVAVASACPGTACGQARSGGQKTTGTTPPSGRPGASSGGGGGTSLFTLVNGFGGKGDKTFGSSGSMFTPPSGNGGYTLSPGVQAGFNDQVHQQAVSDIYSGKDAGSSQGQAFSLTAEVSDIAIMGYYPPLNKFQWDPTNQYDQDKMYLPPGGIPEGKAVQEVAPVTLTVQLLGFSLDGFTALSKDEQQGMANAATLALFAGSLVYADPQQLLSASAWFFNLYTKKGSTISMPLPKAK